MQWIITQVNRAGGVYIDVALPILLTSMVLAGLVLLVEALLRARVRASLRYWLVTCVLAYLVLTPLLSLSPPSTHWPSGSTALAAGVPDATPRAGSPDPTPAPASHTGASSRDFSRAGTPSAPLSQPATGQTQTTRAGMGEPSSRLTWQGAAFLLWLTGAAFLGGVRIRRALAACKRVDGTLVANYLMNDILVYCRHRMGIRGLIRLRIGAEGTAPVVCGLINPVIVVPRNLAPTLGSRHLRDVLFHELAHVKRYDLWVNLAQNILQVLYFYNPLLLVVNVVIRRLREEATDETVLDTIGDADHAYARRLADVAILATKPSAPSLNLIAVA
jgi:beta-lactamase regulating signal transducer with metallopeptidase domain